MIDLTLDRLKRPALKDFRPQFGSVVEVTQKNKGGLSTREIDANIALQYELMREVLVSSSDETSIVEYDSKLSLVGDEAITLVLRNGSYRGCLVRITNRGSKDGMVEYNGMESIVIGPNRSIVLEWTEGGWRLDKEKADILNVTFYASMATPDAKDMPVTCDTPFETITAYAVAGAPINARCKVSFPGSTQSSSFNLTDIQAATLGPGGQTFCLMSGEWVQDSNVSSFRVEVPQSGTYANLVIRELPLDAVGKMAAFTYVVDSDRALEDWARNSSVNDYTSVLIRKGVWTSTREVSLVLSGTSVVVGEPGSQLVFTGCHGLRGGDEPGSDMLGGSKLLSGVTVRCVEGNNTQCYWQLSNIDRCTAIQEGTGWTGTFVQCTNLTRCKSITISQDGVGSLAMSFNSCENLADCVAVSSGGVGHNIGFSNCKRLNRCRAEAVTPGNDPGDAATGVANGFQACNSVVDCVGTGIGLSKGYGFSECTGVARCRAGAHCSNGVFVTSYASLANNSTYAAAASANGGFCDTANPAAPSVTIRSQLKMASAISDALTPASGILTLADVQKKRASITHTVLVRFLGDTRTVEQSLSHTVNGVCDSDYKPVKLPLVIGDDVPMLSYSLEGKALLFLDNSSSAQVRVAMATGTMTGEEDGTVTLADITKVCPTADYFGTGAAPVVGITRRFNDRGSHGDKPIVYEDEPLPDGYDETMVARCVRLPIVVNAMPIVQGSPDMMVFEAYYLVCE